MRPRQLCTSDWSMPQIDSTLLQLALSASTEKEQEPTSAATVDFPGPKTTGTLVGIPSLQLPAVACQVSVSVSVCLGQHHHYTAAEPPAQPQLPRPSSPASLAGASHRVLCFTVTFGFRVPCDPDPHRPLDKGSSCSATSGLELHPSLHRQHVPLSSRPTNRSPVCEPSTYILISRIWPPRFTSSICSWILP